MKPIDRDEPERSEMDDTTVVANTAADENPRLLIAVREYMQALDAGLRPSRREWLERYSDIGSELAACLDGLAFVHSTAGKLNPESLDVPEAVLARPLGDFRLMREIGRGGMGVVYEAIQLSLGRRVAVKVLPFTAALDPRHLQRFRNEAQAAAHLHHTNIVPVYAVGCERSVHYYAMQLIEGQSLSQVLRELRLVAGELPLPDRDASTQPSAMPLPEPRSASIQQSTNLSSLRTSSPASFYQSIARLGHQAAVALEYAHQAGVVHRDIKPSNLMVDVRGNLWITDFGLAQFYDGTELTHTGDLVGTIAYMSPEQACGKAVVLDQRTDIYSLGITLYELVTLHRAFAGKSIEELLQQVASMDPVSPRSIDKRIPRELEVIIEKATAKEPAERYQSAQELADDLSRFLKDEPIHARPPSHWDKTVKWTRRHKSLAVTSLIVLFIAAAGFLMSTILIAREQKRTQANFQEARNAVDFFTRVAEDDMTEPPLTNVRRMLLEKSRAYYQSFLDEHQNDASTTAELSAAKAEVAAILDKLSASESYARFCRRIGLLSEPDVQKDLLMSSTQIENRPSLWDYRSGQGGPPDWFAPDQAATKDGRDYTKLAGQADASLRAALSAQQYDRLAQIDRQVDGPMAFRDHEVVQALRLTDAQRNEITQFIDALFTHHFRDHGPGSPGGPGFNQPDPSDNNQSDVTKQIESLLTPSQLATWQKMIGSPYTGPKHGPFSDMHRDHGPPPDSR